MFLDGTQTTESPRSARAAITVRSDAGYCSREEVEMQLGCADSSLAGLAVLGAGPCSVRLWKQKSRMDVLFDGGHREACLGFG